jgi:hypothetical protein
LDILGIKCIIVVIIHFATKAQIYTKRAVMGKLAGERKKWAMNQRITVVSARADLNRIHHMPYTTYP